MSPERDALIVKRYQEDVPMAALAEEFQISKGRIYQILKKAGVPRRAVRTSERDLFLGINISEDVKNALKAEAARQGVSMSSLSAKSLREMLVQCGHPLEAEKL